MKYLFLNTQQSGIQNSRRSSLLIRHACRLFEKWMSKFFLCLLEQKTLEAKIFIDKANECICNLLVSLNNQWIITWYQFCFEHRGKFNFFFWQNNNKMFEIKCAEETKLSKPIIKFQYYDCEIQKCILGNAACQSKLMMIGLGQDWRHRDIILWNSFCTRR